MRDNNLAYETEYRYREKPDSQKIKHITNIRTTGGVMIKTGSAKTKKVHTEDTQAFKKKNRRSTILSVIVLSTMAFLVLFRGLMLTAGYEKLEEKQAQLSQTITENQKLQFKIDQALDLKNIERVAEHTFNMGQPTKAQTVYLNLDRTDEVKKVREGNSVIGSIKSFFGGIAEYFSR